MKETRDKAKKNKYKKMDEEIAQEKAKKITEYQGGETKWKIVN